MTERMTSAWPGRSRSSPKTSRIVRRIFFSSPVAPPRIFARAVRVSVTQRTLHGRVTVCVRRRLRNYGALASTLLSTEAQANKLKEPKPLRMGRGVGRVRMCAAHVRLVNIGGSFAMANRDKVGEGSTGKSSGGKGGGGGQAGGGQKGSSGGTSKGGGQPGGGQSGGQGGSNR